ncbi:MAG: hypothetical protein AAF551_10685 [Bacteroidota bacterium]
MTSCGNDDDTSLSNQGNAQLANEQNATEETKIPTSTLETGIKIAGATENTGTPPAPNSDLDFELNADLTEAFQGSGLNIEFSSDEAIAGAYILFKDVDGNATSSYLDVPSSVFNNGRSSKQSISKRSAFSTARTLEDFDNIIEVGFGSDVPAGQFCYDICVYDASNNISQISTVCVTVEAWGGNASIVGEWVFDRGEPADEFDSKTTINCENGQTIEVEFEQVIKNEWTFALNEDGTYFEIYDEEGKPLDIPATEESCTASYQEEPERDNSKYSGNWAYNEENQTLTVVDFKFEDFLDATRNETDEVGELYFVGVKAEVISGQLVLTDTNDRETSTYYFNRK